MFRTTGRVAQGITQTVQKRTAHQQVTPRSVLSEKLAEIKEIGPNLSRQLTQIHNEYGVAAHKWAAEQAEKSAQSEQSIFNHPAREAAHTFTICQALRSTLELLEQYNLQLENSPLDSCIIPAHSAEILKAFEDRFDFLSDDEQVQIGAALEPGVLEKAGITCDGKLSARIYESHKNLPENFTPLTYIEFFSLVDYVNSNSGIFNGVNNAIRAKENYNEPFFQNIVGKLSIQITNALEKLVHNPDFAQRDITIFKGISLSNPAGPSMRLFLENCLTNKKPVNFPNVLSGTSNPLQSYARIKSPKEYDGELIIKLDVGIKVGLFHDVITSNQDEVTGLPNKKYSVTEKKTEKVWFDGEALENTKYQLEPF